MLAPGGGGRLVRPQEGVNGDACAVRYPAPAGRSGQEQQVNEQETLIAVKRLHAALDRADMPALMEALTDDVEWEMYGVATMPFGGPRVGKEQVVAWYKQLLSACKFTRLDRREYVTQDDTCIALGYAEGRVRATGRSFTTDWAQVFTVRDGRVCRFREFVDSAAWLAATQPV